MRKASCGHRESHHTHIPMTEILSPPPSSIILPLRAYVFSRVLTVGEGGFWQKTPLLGSEVVKVPVAFAHIAFAAKDLEIAFVEPQVPEFRQRLDVVHLDALIFRCRTAKFAAGSAFPQNLEPKFAPFP